MLIETFKADFQIEFFQIQCRCRCPRIDSKLHHGTQLTEALERLGNEYSKPDFIVSEIYKTHKGMTTITTFKAIRAAKEQVGTLKVALATLKTLGFEDL